ncbi:MAG TPA: hypothetical protein VFR58_10065 [Flavisolibacter sp.]|nr:hypothetical protein [Flavisolibacter sp.]
MNIAIYDTEHFETAYTLIRILDVSSNRLTLFFPKEMADQLKPMFGDRSGSFEWVYLERGNQTNWLLIHSHFRRNRCELLFLNTVAHHHLFFALLCRRLRPASTVLTLHQVNGFFEPSFSFSPRSVLQYAGKKLLAREVSAFAVLLSTTKDYIKEHQLTKKQVFILPGSHFEHETSGGNAGKRLLIAVPGSVDLKRRQYNDLLQTLLLLREGPAKLHFVILGGAAESRSREMLASLNRSSSSFASVKVYDGKFVEQLEYDRVLSGCDFVLAPLSEQFYEGSAEPERYGLTKSSGCFFDAVRFGKPLILPAHLTIPPELKKQCIVYKEPGHLAALLSNMTDEERLAYSQSAVANAQQFRLHILRKSFSSFLTGLGFAKDHDPAG